MGACGQKVFNLPLKEESEDTPPPSGLGPPQLTCTCAGEREGKEGTGETPLILWPNAPCPGKDPMQFFSNTIFSKGAKSSQRSLTKIPNPKYFSNWAPRSYNQCKNTQYIRLEKSKLKERKGLSDSYRDRRKIIKRRTKYSKSLPA